MFRFEKGLMGVRALAYNYGRWLVWRRCRRYDVIVCYPINLPRVSEGGQPVGLTQVFAGRNVVVLKHDLEQNNLPRCFQIVPFLR
jgi:hypothetical protein